MNRLTNRANASERARASPGRATGPTPGKRTLVEQIAWPTKHAAPHDGSARAVDVAQQGTRGASSALPYLDQIQRAFGRHDVSGIRAFQDANAAQAADTLGARGFAIGSSVAFAGAPSLHTAAHEAAHVIQQRRGVQVADGIGRVGDRYEQHAHRVADAVERGEFCEALLDELGPRANAATAGGPSDVVQLDQRAELEHQHSLRGAEDVLPELEGQNGAFADMPDGDRGPMIRHDHGFLDDGRGNVDPAKRRPPRFADKFEHLRWVLKLEGAEFARPDLVDGTAAYRHFLFGKGADRNVQYGRFLANDPAGRVVLTSAMDDVKVAALHRSDLDVSKEVEPRAATYHIRTAPIRVHAGDGRYPYPATENWQKALGAHTVWIEARVAVSVLPNKLAAAPPLSLRGPGATSEASAPSYTRHLQVDMTIHAEDRYNFNPGAADLATGVPDAANGRFEVTGLAQEYMNRGTFAQAFEFDAPIDAMSRGIQGAAPSSLGAASRNGRAEDERGYPTAR